MAKADNSEATLGASLVKAALDGPDVSEDESRPTVLGCLVRRPRFGSRPPVRGMEAVAVWFLGQ